MYRSRFFCINSVIFYSVHFTLLFQPKVLKPRVTEEPPVVVVAEPPRPPSPPKVVLPPESQLNVRQHQTETYPNNIVSIAYCFNQSKL